MSSLNFSPGRMINPLSSPGREIVGQILAGMGFDPAIHRVMRMEIVIEPDELVKAHVDLAAPAAALEPLTRCTYYLAQGHDPVLPRHVERAYAELGARLDREVAWQRDRAAAWFRLKEVELAAARGQIESLQEQGLRLNAGQALLSRARDR